MKGKFRPQVFTAMICIALMAGMIIALSPENIEKIVGAAITGIGMLAMKLAERE